MLLYATASVLVYLQLTFLIVCAGDYYLYNEVSGLVICIVEPMGLPNIIAELRENWRKDINTELLRHV